MVYSAEHTWMTGAPAAHLVLPAFYAPLGDWHLVYSGPVASAFLSLL